MSGLSDPAANVTRANEVFRRLGKEPYNFQAHIAADCLKAIEAKGKALVVAPTGAGKTLISNLIVSLSGQEHEERFPRVFVVVPSKSLLIQHVEDASWLRGEGYRFISYPQIPRFRSTSRSLLGYKDRPLNASGTGVFGSAGSTHLPLKRHCKRLSVTHNTLALLFGRKPLLPDASGAFIDQASAALSPAFLPQVGRLGMSGKTQPYNAC